MDEQIKTWLYDILTAIEEVEGYFGGSPRRFADYRTNLMLKSAIGYKIAIIGEAVNRILKVDAEIELAGARKIVDTRNRVIHGYDSVSDETMWGIVINHLPLLKAEVERMLG